VPKKHEKLVEIKIFAIAVKLTAFKQQHSQRLLIALLLEVEKEIGFKHEPSLLVLDVTLEIQPALNLAT